MLACVRLQRHNSIGTQIKDQQSLEDEDASTTNTHEDAVVANLQGWMLQQGLKVFVGSHQTLADELS